MSAVDLTDSHEVLIAEYEMLERDYDRLRLAKSRSEQRLRSEISELRRHLRNALIEIDELQSLLAKAWVES